MGKRIVFFLLPEAFCGLKYAENAIADGAPPRTPLGELTTLPRSPSRLGERTPLPIPNPTRRLWRLDARAFGASIVVPPLDTKSWRRHCCIVYGRVYVTVRCPRACPSYRPLQQHALDLLLWARQAGELSIDCCTVGIGPIQQQRRHSSTAHSG